MSFPGVCLTWFVSLRIQHLWVVYWTAFPKISPWWISKCHASSSLPCSMGAWWLWAFLVPVCWHGRWLCFWSWWPFLSTSYRVVTMQQPGGNWCFLWLVAPEKNIVYRNKKEIYKMQYLGGCQNPVTVGKYVFFSGTVLNFKFALTLHDDYALDMGWFHGSNIIHLAKLQWWNGITSSWHAAFESVS